MNYASVLAKSASWILIVLLGATSSAEAAPISCIAEGADLSDTAVVRPTHDQRRAALAAYALPSVVSLWQGLQAERLQVADRETATSIAGIDRSRLSDSFSILSSEENPMGGAILVVIFSHYQDAIYRVWMYKLASGSWVVRSFGREACSEQQIRWITNRYSDFDR